jgi:threonine synthase
VVTTATDAEILEAKAVIDASGTGCEPASAASVAGLRRLVREGIIDPGQHVVAVLTGHLLKDPAASLEAVPSSGRRQLRGIQIDPDLASVERVLRDR